MDFKVAAGWTQRQREKSTRSSAEDDMRMVGAPDGASLSLPVLAYSKLVPARTSVESSRSAPVFEERDVTKRMNVFHFEDICSTMRPQNGRAPVTGQRPDLTSAYT